MKAFASARGFCFPRLLSHYYWRGLVYFKTADPLTGGIKSFSETVWQVVALSDLHISDLFGSVV